MVCFPSGEGTKGCVRREAQQGIRCFCCCLGEVVSVRFWVTAFVLGSSAQTSHTPAPLERGALKCCFLFVNEGEWFVSPLERGLRGV